MGAIKIKGSTSGSTTITAPATGSDETIELSTALASKLDVAGGKILQIVRATDTTQRNTTSTSFVDVAGMSVTITPQKSDSAILVWSLFSAHFLDDVNDYQRGAFQLTDSSNNPLSGAEDMDMGTFRYEYNVSGPRIYLPVSILGYSTPATTSAVTYKLRANSDEATITVRLANNLTTGQMYAIEVSA